VIGSTSGPTLETIAARPASNIVASAPMLGCSANARPACAVFGTTGSTPPVWPTAGSAIGVGGVERAAT
jgi:hypothetical protein